jgi:hypothetical protein
MTFACPVEVMASTVTALFCPNRQHRPPDQLHRRLTHTTVGEHGGATDGHFAVKIGRGDGEAALIGPDKEVAQDRHGAFLGGA